MTYLINNNAFEAVDSELKAYILGWLYSRADLRIQIKHLEILKLIANLFDYNGPIHKRGSSYEINIRNRFLSNRLKNLGAVENIHHNTFFPPIIIKELWNHFLRGIFDSYGTIVLNKNKYLNITLTYCESFINDLRKYLAQLNIETKYYYKSMYTNSIQMLITKKNCAFKFLELIYSNSNYYLARNYMKHQSCIYRGV